MDDGNLHKTELSILENISKKLNWVVILLVILIISTLFLFYKMNSFSSEISSIVNGLDLVISAVDNGMEQIYDRMRDIYFRMGEMKLY